MKRYTVPCALFFLATVAPVLVALWASNADRVYLAVAFAWILIGVICSAAALSRNIVGYRLRRRYPRGW